MNIPRLLRTVRYLKPIQVLGRVWFRLYSPLLDAVASPVLRSVGRQWHRSVAKVPSMLAADTFCFLGQTGTLADAGSWNNPSQEKLWLYNLHYFDDLNAQGAAERQQWHITLLQRWVAENPPTGGNGWEPYPTSLRIINWIKWSLAGNALPPGCTESLVLQARWLNKRLEWHLLGNHLFANAKALVFAGLFFEGPEAALWLKKGLRIISQELPEQVLPDGGNFELSTMYHAIFLEDVLDLINIAGAYRNADASLSACIAEWHRIAHNMLVWLQAMLHPDGEISLFNDAAIGIAPTFTALQQYAERLSLPPTPGAVAPVAGDVIVNQLPASGYIRLESHSAVALLDVARIGPDYLPGHAHADTLSFELSVFGRRLVVNGGTSRYGLGPERERERGTTWHSTVEVDGQNSSEVWSGFRVGRRAYPRDLQLASETGVARVACSHDGYQWLPGRPVHRRHWEMSPSALLVHDTLSHLDIPAVARYILHPDVLVEQIDATRWQLSWPDGCTARVTVRAGVGSVTTAWYAPAFGQLLATQCLAVTLVAGEAVTCFEWS